MKATNIFQSLKTAGYCGGKSSNPELPGVSAAKFNAGLKKAAAQGKLDDNPKFKAAVEGSSMNKYKKATMAKKLGPNDPPKKEILADQIITTEYDKETGKGKRVRVLPSGKKVNTSFQVKPSPNTMKATMAKKSCAKFIPEEAGGRKPKTGKPGKARKRATKMLQGLINSNRGCGPNPYR